MNDKSEDGRWFRPSSIGTGWDQGSQPDSTTTPSANKTWKHQLEVTLARWRASLHRPDVPYLAAFLQAVLTRDELKALVSLLLFVFDDAEVEDRLVEHAATRQGLTSRMRIEVRAAKRLRQREGDRYWRPSPEQMAQEWERPA